jgi:hypothetical protein
MHGKGKHKHQPNTPRPCPNRCDLDLNLEINHSRAMQPVQASLKIAKLLCTFGENKITKYDYRTDLHPFVDVEFDCTQAFVI